MAHQTIGEPPVYMGQAVEVSHLCTGNKAVEVNLVNYRSDGSPFECTLKVCGCLVQNFIFSKF